MAAGDPIKLGSLATNGVFLMTSETGIIIASFTRVVDSSKFDFYDGSLGYISGTVYHDFKAVNTIKGAANGATGIMAATVGVAITITNTQTGNGVSSGTQYCDRFEIGHQAGQLREVTMTSMQRAAF
jgi:hypothetical protein